MYSNVVLALPEDNPQWILNLTLETLSASFKSGNSVSWNLRANSKHNSAWSIISPDTCPIKAESPSDLIYNKLFTNGFFFNNDRTLLINGLTTLSLRNWV